MSGFIEIGRELRPCIDIEDGEKLLFHHWISGDIALCEKEDGTMTQRGQCRIKFLDRKHNEYAFEGLSPEKVCTGKRCPMQVGYDVVNCKDKECMYRTETEKGGVE